MRIYDGLIAFSHALKMPYDIDKPIYGVAFNLSGYDRKEIEQNLHSYIQYLCAICQWVNEGGSICDDNGNTWVDKDGNSYLFSIYDEYFKDKYLPHVKVINYTIIFNCNAELEDEDFYEDTDFITKNIGGLWKRHC